MSIDNFTEGEAINIRDLVFKEPKSAEAPLFDPRKDLTPADHAGIKRELKRLLGIIKEPRASANDQQRLLDFASYATIIAPESIDKSQKPTIWQHAVEYLGGMNVLATLPIYEELSRIRILDPKGYDTLGLGDFTDSWRTKHWEKEVVDGFSTTILRLGGNIRILNLDKDDRINFPNEAWDDAAQRIGEFSFTSFYEVLECMLNMKLLGLDKTLAKSFFADQRLLDLFKRGKANLDERRRVMEIDRSPVGYQAFAEIAAKMTMLASDIIITDEDVRFQFPETQESLGATQDPSLPEVRKF